MQTRTFDMELKDDDPIDAVITWVDGSSDKHRTLRHSYMGQSGQELHENAVNPHRWVCSDEILYCLQSIDNFAPWIRSIWIVIDSDTPDLKTLSKPLQDKIHFVTHAEIFADFSHVLPTFNSLAIESMLWRIKGLSERFLYFNDDVFITAPLQRTDVFEGGSPVLRGRWVDYSQVLSGADQRRDPAMFNHFMQLNAARMLGFPATNLFASAHVVHPLRRSVLADLFDQFRQQFISNIGHRFRDLSQFLPQGLHAHACIAAQAAVLQSSRDHLHIHSGQGVGEDPEQTRAVLKRAIDPDTRFLCVNDLPQLEGVVPEARDWISQAIGGFSDGGCGNRL